MAFCIHCGQELVEGAKFCSNCGKETYKNLEPQRKVVYDGEIHKCPNCGDIVDAYETVCEACGFELRGRKATSVVHELSLKLERTDDPEKKDDLIRTFYIPNTKEDIREFFILALSNIKVGGMNTDAWMVKLEQAYQKAELTINNKAELERLKFMYEEAHKLNRKNSALNRLRSFPKLLSSGFAWALLFGVIGVTFLLINIPFGNTILYVIAGISLYVAFMAALFAMGQSEDKKKKNNSANKKNRGANKQNYMVSSIGKDAEDFLNENYDDMVEFLRSRGFENITTKAERKGLLDTEGAIKGISVAGNTEFCEDDEFDVNARILIRYYSRNH